MSAVERALAEGGVQAAGVGFGRSRHDRRDERDHRGQDRAQRLRHDRRLPRPARDRPAGAADALRHAVREDAAARPARPRGRRRRAARAQGRGPGPARRGLGPRGGRAACGARPSSPSPSACSTPTSTRSTSADRRDPRRGAARHPGLALGRGRPRVPRVPSRLDDGDQRGDQAGRRALPRAHRGPPRRGRHRREAARDAVERRGVQLGGGAHGGRSSWSSRAPRRA